MLHLLDDAERMGRNTNIFPLFSSRDFDQRLREYQTLPQENAAGVRNLFIERWNQQLVPLLSNLSSAQIQEAIPMIHAFIEQTVHEVVSQVVEDDINNFLEEGTFEVNDDLRDFIAQADDYQGTPGTPHESPIIIPIENSPHLPLPANENVIIAGLFQNPQEANTPPVIARVVRHLLPGSPLRQEVQPNPQGFTTPQTNAGQPRTAEQAGLEEGRAQGRNVRRRLDLDAPVHQLQYHHDDENGPDGGGVPVN
jgi:hypothetical protein